MRKRLLFNGFLVLVIVAIGAGVFATVHSSSSSAATTQTFATAKRGVVLQSVTSTGNVEAPTDLSLSFQQSGQVTQIAVKPGQHVAANQVLARVDDTQQKIALESAQASLASAQASLAALQRGETAIERQVRRPSRDLRAGRGHHRAAVSRRRPGERDGERDEVRPGDQRRRAVALVGQLGSGDRADRAEPRRRRVDDASAQLGSEPVEQ